MTTLTGPVIKIKPPSRKKKREQDIYMSAIITKKVPVLITNVGKNLVSTFRKK